MPLLGKLRSTRRRYLMALDRVRFRREALRKASLSYPPRHVTVAISSACRNRCVFCTYHSEDARNGASNVYGLRYRMSLQQFQRIVDTCYRGRVPEVHVCATGEPFLHPQILQVLDSAIRVYGRVSLQTNLERRVFERGDFLNEILRRKDDISYITTDLLSGDPAVHERLKKGSSYEDVLGAMEYISARSDIPFEAHYLLTKLNYEHMGELIGDLARRRIKCHLAIVNLHAHGFNEFTALDIVYTSRDQHITAALQQAQVVGREKGIVVHVPPPADRGRGICLSFWTRLQVWPVKGVDEDRYAENVIVGGCNAVVLGNLRSLGYFFDYDDIMDLWNNEHFMRIRADLLCGKFPDEACSSCPTYRPPY